MSELILNQFTRDHDLLDLQGKQVMNIETQSVYSYSLMSPGDCRVDHVQRVNNTTFSFEFSNGSYYLCENGRVSYYD